MRIHNKWYDTTGFDHPGGPIMLSLGAGRDATALFEAHHPFTNRVKLEKLLAKYEIKGDTSNLKTIDENDSGEEFVWPEFESKDADTPAEGAPVSTFAHELRQKVKEYFQAEADRRGISLIAATKPTVYRWFELGVLTLLFLSTLPAFFRGEWWTLVATPFTYWIMGVNVFHDASHFALSQDWRVNMLGTYTGWWFSSPLEWYHQHVIGHHAYPNIPRKDPDLYHAGAFQRLTKTLRWKPVHRHQPVTFYPIWVIGTYAMNFLKPILMFVHGSYNKAVKLMPMTAKRMYLHFAGRAFVFFLCHLLPFFLFPFWKALIWAAFPVGFVSVCFMSSSQVNHLTTPNIDTSSNDYYAHQVLTSHTFGVHNKLVFLFTGGLNCQIEHHLFPTVNHCHLPKLQPIVKSLAKKYNINYHESETFLEALHKYKAHLVNLSTPDKKDQ